MDITKLEARIKAKEGKRLTMYKDTKDKWTIAYGHNLSDKPISDRAAQVILEDDIQDAVADVARVLPWVSALDEVRQLVIVEMAYNMGIHGLLGFTEMLRAAKAGDHAKAADEMLDSEWAVDVKGRAIELAQIYKTGQYFQG